MLTSSVLLRPLQTELPKAHISANVGAGNTSYEAVVKLLSDASVPFVFLDTSIDVRCLFQSYLLSTSLCLPQGQGRFDSNGFLLLAKTPKEVRFHGWEPFDAAALARDLRVRSPRDVYA